MAITNKISALWPALPVILAAFLPAAQTAASEKPALEIQLNTLEQVESACRVTFVVQNQIDAAVNELAFEIVLFNKQAKVLRMTVLNAGMLPERKTRVKRFDLKETKCAEIAHILVNDVARCDGEKLTPAGCLKALSVSNLSGVKFGL